MQISSEAALDEYINFDAETIISEPASDPTHVGWRYESEEKIIAEIFQSEDFLINDLDEF